MQYGVRTGHLHALDMPRYVPDTPKIMSNYLNQFFVSGYNIDMHVGKAPTHAYTAWGGYFANDLKILR